MNAADESAPARGDVMWLQLDPQAGHEQGGTRPVLVLSPEAYNRLTGLAIVCPITSKAKGYPFEVPIPAGAATTGVVLADQIKSLDWRSRRGQFKERLDAEVVNDVVARTLALIDPDEVFGTSSA